MSGLSRRDFARTTLIAAVAVVGDGQTRQAGLPAPKLTEQQQKEIRDRIAAVQPGLEAMRAYALANDVEPATIFRIYRAPSRQRRVQTHRK